MREFPDKARQRGDEPELPRAATRRARAEPREELRLERAILAYAGTNLSSVTRNQK